MGDMENYLLIARYRLWQRIKWFWRAWPFIVVGLLALGHQVSLYYFPANRVLVHKFTGTAMQAIGGLIVLYSVNDNLGLFRNKSLLSIFTDWFRSFPVFGRPITLSANGVAQASASATASASVGRIANTLEERVDALEQQLKNVNQEMLAKEAALNNRIDVVRVEMSQTAIKHQTEIQKLADNLERTAVGSFKLQGFGVMLALYGAGISAFT